jgi:hypothetical protein
MIFLRVSQEGYVKSRSKIKKKTPEIVDFMESKFFSEGTLLC